MAYVKVPGKSYQTEEATKKREHQGRKGKRQGGQKRMRILLPRIRSIQIVLRKKGGKDFQEPGARKGRGKLFSKGGQKRKESDA